MSINNDFLSLCKLSNDGSFKLQLPSDSREKPVIVQVKSLSTKLPFDFLKNGKLCDDKSDTPDFDRSSEVKMMKLQPLNLPFFDSYTANNFLLATSKTTSVENRLKNNLDSMFNYEIIDKDRPLSINDMFPEGAINEIYNQFHEKDVVIFAEYGLSLNVTGRIKSTVLQNKEIKQIFPSQNNGVHSMDSRIYGFNLGFRFLHYNTVNTIEPSVFIHQFVSEVFNRLVIDEDKYGIYDMLRFVLTDLGDYETFGQPDLVQMQVKREGFGIYIFFEKIGTYANIVFTAGALPYVPTFDDLEQNPNIFYLSDPDYGDDFKPAQSFVVLRETKSRLACDKGEYTMSVVQSRGDRYSVVYSIGDEEKKDISRTNMYDVFKLNNLENNIYFDNAVPFQPLFDLYINGNYLNCPIYGGVGGYLNIFYAYFYWTNVADRSVSDPKYISKKAHYSFEERETGKITKLRIPGQSFCLTGTGYMNFCCGIVLPYFVMNGLSGVIKEDGQWKPDLTRINFTNPLLKGEMFTRLTFMSVYRDRTYSEKIREGFKNVINCLALKVKNTPMKAFLSNDGIDDTAMNIVEIFPTVSEAYPVRDYTNISQVAILPGDPKPIFSERSFQFFYDPHSYKDRDYIEFKFCAFDRHGTLLKCNFEDDDEILLKGSFVSRN